MNLIENTLNTFRNFNMFTIVDKDYDVLPNLKQRYFQYCEKVQDIDNNLGDIVNSITVKIINCFNDYYNGKLSKSIEAMDRIVSDTKAQFYIHNMNSNESNIYHNSNKFLYKGIIARWNENIDREYIMHIPFDKRELITTQRYSIPGTPCLYLGQSLYIVWEELNRPSLNDLFISRFELDLQTRILDLGLSIKDLEELVNTSAYFTDEFKNTICLQFLFTNILKLACSFKVKQEKRVFKSEYIIPQLILMSIINQDIADGIRYPSTKTSTDFYINMNYAFPAIQSNNEDKISKKLKSLISLTNPVNLGLYDFKNAHIINETDNLYRNISPIKLNDEFIMKYENTKLFQLELSINQDAQLKSRKLF